MINAHLNGGPLDDQDVVVDDDQYRVAKRPTLDLTETADVTAIGPICGRYQIRVDDNGQPVPHSLDSYSFDWQGWDA